MTESNARGANDPSSNGPIELDFLAAKFLAAGNLVAATTVLRQLLKQNSGDPVRWFRLATMLRAQSDFSGAYAALDSALNADPRFFLALLMKGSLQDREGNHREAARSYGAALVQAPPAEQMDVHTQAALVRAREVNHVYVSNLREHVLHSVVGVASTRNERESKRVALFIDATLGIRRVYKQEPTEYFFPGLPAIEFYDRSEFPWLAQLESSTDDIRKEMLVATRRTEDLEPYVTYPPGVPLDQWNELNHSHRWSAFHFYHQGRYYKKNCALCPQTIKALSALPQPTVAGRMPAAMFSVLRPRTRIPPHTGVANIRLVLHLPLVVPDGCGFRVGNETRQWRVGEGWIFDDTIEHEAWNESDHDRVVLICDIWNPRLSADERALISSVITSMDEFNDHRADSGI